MANNKKAFLGVGGKPKFSQPDQQKHIDSVSKNIAILTGQTKNTKDRAVLVRDLMDFGLLDARGRFKSNGGTTIVGSGNNGGGIVNPDPETPTKPVNVRASAAFTTIMVQWDFPNYAGHEHAEIWRNTVDTLGDMTDPREEGEAVLVATVAGSMYMDNVLPETGYYYWVRFVNTEGLPGPVHGPSGVYAETLPDIETILTDFQEESLETLQTFQDGFNSQIQRIDSQIDDFGFEASKVLLEQLKDDMLLLSDGLMQHVATTQRNYYEWVDTTYALDQRIGASEANITENYYTRADSDSAITIAIESFSTNYLADNYKNNAELEQAFYTKSGADEAISRSISLFNSEVLSPNYASRAFLSANYYTRATTDAAITAKVDEFRAEVVGSDGSLTNAFTRKVEEVLAGPDGAIAQEIAEYGVTYGGNTYTIAEGIQVSVDINGEYTKQWGVQSEVGDLQHGVGFIDNNGTTTFMASTDNFAVFNPVNGEWEAVFGVRDGRVVITEAVIGDAFLETLAVQFSAVFENEVLVNGELTAWKLKGAQITGNALWMVNGNHSLAIEPDDFLAFWYGEAVYYNVETNTDNRSLGNAKFALMNNGRVLARGMELYDNDNNLIMDADGVDGTYIKNLTVDTLKIKNNAVTVKSYSETDPVNVPKGGSNVMWSASHYHDGEVVKGNLLVDVVIEAIRTTGGSPADQITFTVEVFESSFYQTVLASKSITVGQPENGGISFFTPVTIFIPELSEESIRVKVTGVSAGEAHTISMSTVVQSAKR